MAFKKGQSGNPKYRKDAPSEKKEEPTMTASLSAAITAIETIPPQAPTGDHGAEIVKFKCFTTTEMTVKGKMLPDMSFSFRRKGAPADEMPNRYRVIFGGFVNEAPRYVVEHLEGLYYPKYEQYKDPATGDVILVENTNEKEMRFNIAIVG